MKNYVGLLILAAAACLIGGLLLVVDPVGKKPASVHPMAMQTNATVSPRPKHRRKPVWIVDNSGATNQVTNIVDSLAVNPVSTDGPPILTMNGYVIQDPMARIALSYIGVDPDADIYWAEAINDPNLPAEERRDLIEDLNEDGLDDPDDPTPDDLQIIAYRLELIDELGPNAMDQVNADAFKTAYEDLANMLNGIPVN